MKYTLSILLFHFIILSPYFTIARIDHHNNTQNKIDKIKSFLPNHTDSALVYAEELLLTPNTSNDSIKAIGHYFLGVIYYFKGQYHISASYYLNALNSDYANSNEEFRGKCTNNIGVVYDLTGQFELALDQYLITLEIDKKNNDKLGIAQSKLNIGLLYMNLKQFDKAFVFTQESKEIYKELHNQQGLGLANHNMGKIEIDKGRSQNALGYLLQSNKHFILSGDEYERCMLLHNLARAYINLENYPEAKKYITESGKIAQEKKFKYIITRNHLLTAELFIEQQQYAKAKKYVLNTERFNERTEMNKQYLLLRISLLTHKDKEAESNLTKYLELINSQDEKKTKQLVNELHIKYDSEKKHNTIKEQEQLISTQKKKLIILLIIGTSFLVFIFLILFYKRKLQQSYNLLYQKSLTTSKYFDLQFDKSIESSHLNDKKSNEENILWNNILTRIKSEELWRNPKLTIDDLAKQCQTNKSYISTSIKNNSNDNFSTLINNFRIEEAKIILSSNNNFTMEKIAEVAGFNSSSSFFRIFKDQTGLTPKKYKDLPKITKHF